jgi:hypothetical protein
MLGQDDIAHNRLLKKTKDGFVRIPGYGKRNKKETCYCAELKRLGIKRK